MLGLLGVGRMALLVDPQGSVLSGLGASESHKLCMRSHSFGVPIDEMGLARACCIAE